MSDVIFKENNPNIKAFRENDVDFISFEEYVDILSEHGYFREDYYGKSKQLIEAEEAMTELINDMKANPLADYTNHPYNVKLQNALKKQFGFGRVFIIWRRTAKAAPNAFTLFSADVIMGGVGNDMPHDFIIIDKKSGYYDSKHRHVCIIEASSTMPSQFDLSPEEALAMLLHEIGHNFDHSVYMAFTVITSIIDQLMKVFTPKTVYTDMGPETVNTFNPNSIINVALMTNPGKKAYRTISSIIEKILDKIPITKKIMSGVNSVISYIAKGIEYITTPVSVLAMPVVILMSPLYHLLKVPTRKGEEFADSFATVYGYAAPLATALNKLMDANMIDPKKAVNNTLPITKIMTDMALLNRYVLSVFMNDHGSNDTRMMTSIKVLKAEIASGNYPPEVVSALNNQLQQLQNVYDTYVNYGSPNQKLTVTIFARKLINDIFNGESDFIAKLFPDNLANDVGITESYDDKVKGLIIFANKTKSLKDLKNKTIDDLQNNIITEDCAINNITQYSNELINIGLYDEGTSISNDDTYNTRDNISKMELYVNKINNVPVERRLIYAEKCFDTIIDINKNHLSKSVDDINALLLSYGDDTVITEAFGELLVGGLLLGCVALDIKYRKDMNNKIRYISDYYKSLHEDFVDPSKLSHRVFKVDRKFMDENHITKEVQNKFFKKMRPGTRLIIYYHGDKPVFSYIYDVSHGVAPATTISSNGSVGVSAVVTRSEEIIKFVFKDKSFESYRQFWLAYISSKENIDIENSRIWVNKEYEKTQKENKKSNKDNE